MVCRYKLTFHVFFHLIILRLPVLSGLTLGAKWLSWSRWSFYLGLVGKIGCPQGAGYLISGCANRSEVQPYSPGDWPDSLGGWPKSGLIRQDPCQLVLGRLSRPGRSWPAPVWAGIGEWKVVVRSQSSSSFFLPYSSFISSFSHFSVCPIHCLSQKFFICICLVCLPFLHVPFLVCFSLHLSVFSNCLVCLFFLSVFVCPVLVNLYLYSSALQFVLFFCPSIVESVSMIAPGRVFFSWEPMRVLSNTDFF